tara:strand:- start:6184 stop:6870 length:687 start_codon:yes stop_codon:yes gene_type:complete
MNKSILKKKMENITVLQRKALSECILNLRNIKIIDHLNKFIPNKQEFINQANSMNNLIGGDGSGLGGGILVDSWIVDYFTEYIKGFQEYHVRESDYKILDIPYSFKKITGGSDIALSWSKNPDGACERNYWEVDIMILNLKSGKWWSRGPNNPSKDIDYTKVIPAGLYIIDKNWAKNNISISCNNKTNAKIDKHYVYEALITSINNKTFLQLPDPIKLPTPSFLNLFN